MKYDYVVLLGRMQPVHKGHIHLIRQALKISKNVIILIGSANSGRNPRNPFTFKEREDMIYEALKEIKNEDFLEGSPYERVFIEPLNDYLYRDAEWISEVDKIVNDTISFVDSDKTDAKIAIFGFDKDSTTYYLKMFPQWEVELIDTQFGSFNATDIRNAYFQKNPVLSPVSLANSTIEYLTEFALTQDFKYLLDEYEYDRNYNPKLFDVIVCCVDAVVVQSGYILLVTRKNTPGKGKLALPGGHLNPKETFRKAVIRELKEETNIKDHKGEIPPAILSSYIIDERLFDDPTRSSRARVITNAYLFKLPDSEKLFEVKGMDDAEHAQWYRISQLKADMFHDDHSAIISCMLNVNLE